MPDYRPLFAADDNADDVAASVNPGAIDLGAADRPVTPTTPTSPISASFYMRQPPANNQGMAFSLHALGINTSPLGTLGRRLPLYGGDSDDDDDDEDEEEEGDEMIRGGKDDYSNGSSIDSGLNNQAWRSGDGNDPIALEDRKDVLIDRLNDVVRHVTSYSPSSPSLSNRSASTWDSPGKGTSAKAGGNVNHGNHGSHANHGYDNLDDGTVLSALHAHIDEMEAVLAAAQAAEAAAAAASPRHHHHHHHSHHPHYPWQRPERRSRASTPSVISDRSPRVRTMTKTSTAPFLLEAAPVLLRDQSSSSFRTAPAASSSLQTPKEMAEIPPPVVAVSHAVAVGCDALAGDLSAVLANLVQRRQESETIQEALLFQLSAANSRTAELEAQVKSLTEAEEARRDPGPQQGWPTPLDKEDSNSENDDDAESKTETATEKAAEDTIGGDGDDDDDNDDRLDDRLDDLGSELSFLRLQLRGIEVRCRSYVPADADPELTESIENWKADWSALRAKVDEERRSTATMSMSMSTDTFDGKGAVNDMNSTF